MFAIFHVRQYQRYFMGVKINPIQRFGFVVLLGNEWEISRKRIPEVMKKSRDGEFW